MGVIHKSSISDKMQADQYGGDNYSQALIPYLTENKCNFHQNLTVEVKDTQRYGQDVDKPNTC